MRGRPGDSWLESLSRQPIQEQLEVAAARGFGAVYVERRAYEDRGQSLEAELRNHLGPPLATDRAGNLAVYRLAARGVSSRSRVATSDAR